MPEKYVCVCQNPAVKAGFWVLLFNFRYISVSLKARRPILYMGKVVYRILKIWRKYLFNKYSFRYNLYDFMALNNN